MDIRKILITINGTAWEVYTQDSARVLVKDPTRDDDGFLGCCNKSRKRIWIKENLKEQMFREVLAHEICHALWTGKEKMTEEEVCHFLCRHVFDIVNIVDKIQEELCLK